MTEAMPQTVAFIDTNSKLYIDGLSLKQITTSFTEDMQQKQSETCFFAYTKFFQPVSAIIHVSLRAHIYLAEMSETLHGQVSMLPASVSLYHGTVSWQPVLSSHISH